MATSVSTAFGDSTYSTSNKPVTTTLKSDITAIETAINTHNAATTGEHGVTGTFVGTSDAQTLTNKTISGASNTLSVLSAAWPIGSVFTSVVSTNPNTLLGFGTWSSIAAGRMLIGLDSGDTKFDTVEETGGAETATLTTTELPAHTHTGTTTSDGAHTHTIASTYNGSTSGGNVNRTSQAGDSNTVTTASDGAHTHTFTTDSSGTGSAFSIMNPYFVVYFWKRTA